MAEIFVYHSRENKRDFESDKNKSRTWRLKANPFHLKDRRFTNIIPAIISIFFLSNLIKYKKNYSCVFVFRLYKLLDGFSRNLTRGIKPYVINEKDVLFQHLLEQCQDVLYSNQHMNLFYNKIKRNDKIYGWTGQF